MFENITCKIK